MCQPGLVTDSNWLGLCWKCDRSQHRMHRLVFGIAVQQNLDISTRTWQQQHVELALSVLGLRMQ